MRKFLRPRGITQTRFAEAVAIASPNLNRFIKGGASVNAAMAWKFAMALGTSPQYWMDLQVTHDLWRERPRRRVARVRANRHVRQRR
jgi:addiction module HigA family antidote